MLIQTAVSYLSLAFFTAFSCSLLLGIAKSGIKGLAVLIVTGLALVHGARESTGILIPLLICGDILAVIYYKQHVKWDKDYNAKGNRRHEIRSPSKQKDKLFLKMYSF